MTVTYSEGGRTWFRLAVGVGFVFTLAVFIYLATIGPVSAWLQGRSVSRMDTIGIPVLFFALLVQVVVVRVIARVDVPISIEPGVVHFPRKGTWNVILGRTVVLPTTHIAEVDIIWDTWRVDGGGLDSSVRKIIVKTVDGTTHSKLYPIYSISYQEWAQDTASRLHSLLGSKVRRIDRRSGASLPVRSS